MQLLPSSGPLEFVAIEVLGHMTETSRWNSFGGHDDRPLQEAYKSDLNSESNRPVRCNHLSRKHDYSV